jgi:hypothetical protein
MKLFFAFFYIFIFNQAFSQNIDSTLMQLSFNNELLQKHYISQEIFDKGKQLTYQIDINQEISPTFLFSTFSVIKYDLSTNQNAEVKTWNFHFKEIKIEQKKARIIYNFYPFWNTCNDGTQYLQYSNGIYFTVETNLVLKKGKWKIKSSDISDIKFEEWMKFAGFKCIIENYKPIK